MENSNPKDEVVVLTTGIGETIHVGDSIKVTVLETKDGQTQIGFHIPKGLPVCTAEAFYRTKHEKPLASDKASESKEKHGTKIRYRRRRAHSKKN